MVVLGFSIDFFFGGGCSKGTCQCLSWILTEQSDLRDQSLSKGVTQQESLADLLSFIRKQYRLSVIITHTRFVTPGYVHL